MRKWIAIIVTIPVLIIGWWLVSPLFLDEVVNEEPVTVTVAQPEEAEEATDQQVVEEQEVTTVTMLSGSFVDADAIHQVSGDVKVDGENIRIENLDATNGPDLFLYLVEEGQETKDGVNLGELKGNKGNQNYFIPKDITVKEGMRLVVWCKQFDVDFGYAILSIV
ncbi:DM13 domain-containing protein [Mangrovibacillus cuniculi]|uniref:DM13 domain-containing protein n=1 Tax=Mangrovibacillus cuniculi TaxID=2593652 RepID=A0A7S8HGP8_9BACI|nr:DM13 domain-containing protein [Mangrovibacillus cuniculi]QPC47796.1 DM13 domain-containing protein [Mangrovibacillus cuniculi]